MQLFETSDSLRTVVVSDMPLGMIGQAAFPLGVGIAGMVGQTGAPLLIHDVTKEPRFLSLGANPPARSCASRSPMARISMAP